MSLLFHGRAIARAVAGELPPDELAALRAHLRGCAACRARYDQLARTADALDGGAASAARERAALMRTLEGGAAPRAVAPKRAWVRAAFVLAPAAVLAVWWARPLAPPGVPASEDVTLRGATDAPAAPYALVLHASRVTGPATRDPVRLVGELPGSGEVRVSRDDYVQLGVRGLRAPMHVRVLTVDAAGTARDELAGQGGILARPGAGLVPLGRSVALARGRSAGPLRLVAILSPRPVTEGQVRAATAGTPLDPEVAVVAGSLIVEP